MSDAKPEEKTCPTPNEYGRCDKMKFTQHYDSEGYSCDACGQRYTLYYEDMA